MMEILMPATICSKSNNHDFEEAEMPKSHHGVFYKTTTKVRPSARELVYA